MLTTTEYYDRLVASAVNGHSTVGVDGPLYHAQCMLFVNEPVINKATVLADLTEPVYSGYGNTTPTFTGPVRDGELKTALQSDLQIFQLDPGDDEENINGYALLDSAGTHLLAVERFDTPVGLVDQYSYCAFTIQLTFQQDNPGGASLVQ